MYSLSFSQSHYKFTIFFANLLWFHYLFSCYQFTICFVNLVWIPYLLRESAMNSLSFSRTYFEFTLLSQTHYEFTIFLRICYDFTIFFSQIRYQFTICFVNLVWIPYLFRERTLNLLSFSQIHYEFTLLSQTHYEFSIFFANSLWFHYLFRQHNEIFKIVQFWTLSFVKGWLMRSIDEIARQPLRIFKFKVLMT